MADEGDVLTDLNTPSSGNGADNRPTAGFITQYIKDLSVENPNSPASFQWQVNDEISEVELKINATANCENGQLYVIELVYAGLVGVRNMPEDQMHMFLFAEAPRILFPFARRVVADATRDLGFQPDGRSDRLQRAVPAAPSGTAGGRRRCGRRGTGRQRLTTARQGGQ